MSPDIPDELAARANTFPETSYGATTVSLILVDGRRIDGVVLSGARIVKIGPRLVTDSGELDFNPGDAVGVVRADRPVFATLRQIRQRIISTAGRIRGGPQTR